MPLAVADAFLVPLLVSEIGIPMIGMRILSTFPPSDAVTAQASAFRAQGAEVGRLIQDVERLLARSGLDVPPRPDTFEDYLRWADAAVAGVARATGPETPAGAVAAVGRCLGESMQTLALRIVVLGLGGGEHDGRLAARYAEHLARLDQLARFPTLPQDLRPIVERLAATARVVAAVEEGADRLAFLKVIYSRLAEGVRALRWMVGG
jgi:hypothetical protein